MRADIGFLDGGDRAILFESHSHSSRMAMEDVQEDIQPSSSDITPNSSFGSNLSDSTAFTTTTLPTNTLLVSKLPALLFSQPRDLHPLLDPFGQISRLDIIEPPSVSGAISVRVEYSSTTSAREAKEALQGNAMRTIASMFNMCKLRLVSLNDRSQDSMTSKGPIHLHQLTDP